VITAADRAARVRTDVERTPAPAGCRQFSGGKIPMNEQDRFFERLWQEAKEAAQIAGEAEIAKLDLDEGPRPRDGCAFLEMPRSLPFARWATAALDPIWEDGELDDPHPERLLLGDSQFSFVCDDILSVHEAAARAAHRVLCRVLQTAAITVVTG
jgi:hypothetical protein